jgi:hypothetical protein
MSSKTCGSLLLAAFATGLLLLAFASPDTLVSLALGWLLVGTTIWALMDPVRHAEFVSRWWVKRHGELPTAAVLVCAVVVSILLWPRIAIAAIRLVVR